MAKIRGISIISITSLPFTVDSSLASSVVSLLYLLLSLLLLLLSVIQLVDEIVCVYNLYHNNIEK